MNCVKRLAVLTFTAISLLGLSGCSSLSSMTKEEAIEKDKKDQVYDSHASLANNICGYLSIVCPKDASITKEQFEKNFLMFPCVNWPRVFICLNKSSTF